ncbi:8-oxo-dGTP diphosphatase MutT [Bacteroidota bacterium]|nr:8-oxo-dGTP diphosphatase MutT [Bacteroidota bacterium]
MIEVTAAIIRNNNKTLIARRGPNKHLGGYWEFPGGKIENGETPEECLVREIKEELGVSINVIEFFMDNTHHYPNKSILLKAYFCDLISGSFELTDHDKIEWIERSEFKDFKFAPADIPIINSL